MNIHSKFSYCRSLFVLKILVTFDHSWSLDWQFYNVTLSYVDVVLNKGKNRGIWMDKKNRSCDFKWR